MKENPIADLSLRFALRILEICRKLQQDKEYIISRQLLRSSTSIGANVYEASASPTRKDFANKMAIASKEARETYFWLKLIDEGKLVSFSVQDYIEDLNEIIKILTAIVKTAQGNINSNK